ncbi:HNH endonuclease [Pseudomonas sp. UMAB-40]|uniref:HNH endonuclease n=1 Tax=Pseudomonas sp. UMAB-40 TaxID=1365407 RepID=UPI00214AAE6B|nr:HNH endonuclease [Pseudomonas sp. UMAB-40]
MAGAEVDMAMTRAALAASQGIEQGRFIRAVGHETLMQQHQFTSYTANAYLNCYACMRSGRRWTATVSDQGVNMMLTSIFASFGAQGLYSALRALEAHIFYFENRTGHNCVGLRATFARFTQLLTAEPAALVPVEDFEARVERAKRLPPEERRRLIAEAPTQPVVEYRLVKQFNRNPYVVVEVLERAQGVCEGCKLAAPFTRKSNGTPYLEVHHQVKLAEGGADTVENAFALCPNCHRERHHGISDLVV